MQRLLRDGGGGGNGGDGGDSDGDGDGDGDGDDSDCLRASTSPSTIMYQHVASSPS